MTTAVIGATGRVGGEIVRGILARGEVVTVLVRDPDKARRAFGEPGGLHIRRTRLDDPNDLTEALDGIRTVFIAMGSIGIEDVLQRVAINAAASVPSIEQVTRLSGAQCFGTLTGNQPASPRSPNECHGCRPRRRDPPKWQGPKRWRRTRCTTQGRWLRSCDDTT